MRSKLALRLWFALFLALPLLVAFISPAAAQLETTHFLAMGQIVKPIPPGELDRKYRSYTLGVWSNHATLLPIVTKHKGFLQPTISWSKGQWMATGLGRIEAIAFGRPLSNDADQDQVALVDGNRTLHIKQYDWDGRITLKEVSSVTQRLSFHTDTILFADVDGDNDEDLITGKRGETKFYIYLNSGDNETPFAAPPIEQQLIEEGQTFESIQTLDSQLFEEGAFDDTWSFLLVTRDEDQKLRLYACYKHHDRADTNKPSVWGPFTRQLAEIYAQANLPSFNRSVKTQGKLVVGDFDGNGGMDLAFTERVKYLDEREVVGVHFVFMRATLPLSISNEDFFPYGNHIEDIAVMRDQHGLDRVLVAYRKTGGLRTEYNFVEVDK